MLGKLKEDGRDGGLSHDGAGHGFFYYHTPMYRPEAAMDGWEKVSGFSARYLPN
jgi:carboxymethylenebutenolidase